ncbi:MAG: hypothetical protein AB8B97_27660 [Granulosicoccus sp.]
MPVQPTPPVITRQIGGDPRIVGPVLQFSLFIVPIVMNCFYMVYSLAGWVIDGRDKLNWSLEAPTVGIWVCAGMLLYCALVLGYVRWRGGSFWHPLSVSSVVHILIALSLTVSIFATVSV